ncbi:ACD11 homolog protein-like [Mangifera indica]|uniref:ACD11 homolog protein-like n=1 Tax=Mangifera indica TaxID=29780 RepID=UPI001CFA973C|nr:ACD11 homolog protein-like [Mangifera indica]
MMHQEVKYRVEEEKQEDLSSTSATTRTETSTSLDLIVVAFEGLAELLNSGNDIELRLDTFCDSCSLVSVLFSCLGIAFKFAEMEYVAKVSNLVKASKTYETLHEILDRDIANGSVKTPGSNSRNLRRVRQGLDLIRALFENFLATNDESLKEAASSAYAQVCAPFHSWTVRTAVYAGMCALPTRDQLLQRLNETDESAEKKMKRYIDASVPVIQYIDNLYISRNIKLDW